MEMMHSEMEMVESVKHHEANVAIVNAQIERVKVCMDTTLSACQPKQFMRAYGAHQELILQEQDRYKTLKSALENDEREIKRIEEEQIGNVCYECQLLLNDDAHECSILLPSCCGKAQTRSRFALQPLVSGSRRVLTVLICCKLDNVHYHENEIKLLAADYQHMRLAMLSLQRGSAQMTVILQRIGQDEAEMNEEINARTRHRLMNGSLDYVC